MKFHKEGEGGRREKETKLEGNRKRKSDPRGRK